MYQRLWVQVPMSPDVWNNNAHQVAVLQTNITNTQVRECQTKFLFKSSCAGPQKSLFSNRFKEYTASNLLHFYLTILLHISMFVSIKPSFLLLLHKQNSRLTFLLSIHFKYQNNVLKNLQFYLLTFSSKYPFYVPKLVQSV